MVKKLIYCFHNMRIQNKILLYVYSIVLLTFSITSIFLLSYAEKSARNDALNSIFDTISYTGLLIEKEQQYLYGIAQQYSISLEIQNMIRLSNMGEHSVKVLDKINPSIKSQMKIVGFAVYNKYGDNIDYISNDASRNPIKQDPNDPTRPISKLISGPSKYVWEYIPQGSGVYLEHDNSPKICIWHVVLDNITLRRIGVIAISLDSRRLVSSHTATETLYDNLIVVDDNSNIVIHDGDKHNKLTDEDIKYIMKQINTFEKNGYLLTTINEIEYNIAYLKTHGQNFTVLATMPNDSFLWNNKTYFSYSLLGIILSVIILFPLLIIISSIITRPLNILMQSMQDFKDGDENAYVNFKYKDEIGKIGTMFNEMILEINRLIKEKYLITIEKQAAQLSIMQAQINPHFIYNVLNSIQWTAIDKGEEEIAQLIYSIGRIFRITLNRGVNYFTISQECELLEYYLMLQKRRFGDRLTYELDFDNSILSVKIPKLIIQPLVENSIIHGFKDNTSNIHIKVKAYPIKNGDYISIEVIDNGCGIPKNILSLLPDKLTKKTNTEGSNFAMKNIADRLKLYYYNHEYHFDIQSEENGGVHIHIQIPAIELFDIVAKY